MPIVYLDILIVLNWVIDGLLLSAVAQWLRLSTRRFRILLGGLVGGICSCMIVLPSLPSIIRIGLDIAMALLMIRIAFPYRRFGLFLKSTVCFFAISALFSGVVTLLSSWVGDERIVVNNGMLYVDISPITLTIFSVISYAVIRLCERFSRKRMPHGEYRIRWDDGVGECVGRALCDTGLHLREPFSNASVIVMEAKIAAPFLREDIKTALAETAAHPRIRMIPYHTVGGNGLLPAFRPKKAMLERLTGDKLDITGVYVALCESLGRGEYDMLIGNEWEETTVCH